MFNTCDDLEHPFIHYVANQTAMPTDGFIIRGWAPQLLILSHLGIHPSIGGFLSHCGWYLTVEAVCIGMPSPSPIRGDQILNAKLMGRFNKIQEDDEATEIITTKDDIIEAIERLMSDEELHERAKALRNKVFKHGFRASSLAAFKALRDFISQTVS
ncbi:unnamed protein product [Coffea canephora]|uniref:DH200=94 genomic scaffold, scaffold_2416 n=1 Tax=Coffea canephora TaxID=49390 RepID=A0A068VKE7_COFCA|nr:unnamed protein product [Coffea canephora]